MSEEATEAHVQVLLDEIADEFLVRLRNGESPSIESYAQSHPELAPKIRELLQTIGFVNDLRGDSQSSSSQPARLSQIQLGNRLGSYLIRERLGLGGMGVVFRAEHDRLRRPVALKVLPANSINLDSVSRFKREMQAGGQLSSPNVVATFDAGECDGFHYIAMELIEGCDLAKVMLANERLNVASAAEIIRQAANGLQNAHEAGMVHRDIKPSNLILSEDGVVKILDLGLAKLQSDTEDLTGSRQIVGTVDYVAAEQARDSRQVDIRTDIYSLGATFCKLLTGQPPYSGPSMTSAFEKLTALATCDPPSVAARGIDLPEELVQIVDRMTRQDPSQRFQTPKEIAEALQPWADGSELSKILAVTKEHTERLSAEARAKSKNGTRLPDRETAAANQIETAKRSQLNASLQSPKTAAVRSSGSRRLWLGLGLLLVAACIWLAQILIKTPDGNIIVETEGGETAVSVLGETAEFTDPHDGKKVTVSIDSSKGQLTFEKDGFKAFGSRFEFGKPDQKVTVSFEATGDEKDLAPANVKPWVTAAFDNRQGYAYVFRSDGRYDKVINRSNRVGHQLGTFVYWNHAFRHGRDSKVSAILTTGYDHSVIFYNDGMQSVYHNPSRVELDTRPTGNVAISSSKATSQNISAAIGWASGENYLFFDSGQCSKLDAKLIPLETKETSDYFPYLKGKEKSLTAARVDNSTKLAFFYFDDATVLVADAKTNEEIESYDYGVAGAWQVPQKYFDRAEPPARVIRSPHVEVVNWMLDHGMEEIWCRPEAKVVKVSRKESFDTRLMPPVGARINTDHEQSHRTMLTLVRFAKVNVYCDLESLALSGSKPVSDELFQEMDIPSLRELQLDRAISVDELKKIRVRGIESLTLGQADGETLKAALSHFPNLKTLNVIAEAVTPNCIDHLGKHPTLEKLVLYSDEPVSDIVDRIEKANPDIEIVASSLLGR
jgi:serine/threonine protein kinase